MPLYLLLCLRKRRVRFPPTHPDGLDFYRRGSLRVKPIKMERLKSRFAFIRYILALFSLSASLSLSRSLLEGEMRDHKGGKASSRERRKTSSAGAMRDETAAPRFYSSDRPNDFSKNQHEICSLSVRSERRISLSSSLLFVFYLFLYIFFFFLWEGRSPAILGGIRGRCRSSFPPGEIHENSVYRE